MSNFVGFFFSPESYFSLSESRLGGLFVKLRQPLVAEVLFVIASVLVVYQRLLPQNMNFLAPFLVVTGLLLVDKEKLKVTKSTLWLLAFYLVMTISSILAIFSGLEPHMILNGWLIWFQFGLFIIAGMSLNIKRVASWLTFILLPVAALGIFQFFTTKVTTPLWVSEFEHNIVFRAYSIVGDPNVFGMLSAVGLIASLTLVFSRKYRYFLAVPVFAVAVLLSYSRTTWLSLGVAAVVILVINGRKYLIYTPFAALGLLVPKIRERVLVVFNPDFLMVSSIDGRLWIWNNAIHLWKQRVLLGFGPGSYGGQTALTYASPVYIKGIQDGFVAIYYSDSSWVQLLVQGGLLGFLSLLGFFVSAIMQIVSNLKKSGRSIYLGGLAALIFVAVASITSNVIEFGTVIIPCSLLIGSALSEA